MPDLHHQTKEAYGIWDRENQCGLKIKTASNPGGWNMPGMTSEVAIGSVML